MLVVVASPGFSRDAHATRCAWSGRVVDRRPVFDAEYGAASRDRTRDILITNQALYQLSYDGMDGTAGFEPATFETKTRRSTS